MQKIHMVVYGVISGLTPIFVLASTLVATSASFDQEAAIAFVPMPIPMPVTMPMSISQGLENVEPPNLEILADLPEE